MSIIIQVILGLLFMIMIYFVLSKVVEMPQIHRYANQQYERFIQNLYQYESEENKE